MVKINITVAIGFKHWNLTLFSDHLIIEKMIGIKLIYPRTSSMDQPIRANKNTKLIMLSRENYFQKIILFLLHVLWKSGVLFCDRTSYFEALSSGKQYRRRYMICTTPRNEMQLVRISQRRIAWRSIALGAPEIFGWLKEKKEKKRKRNKTRNKMKNYQENLCD
uniref:Uncharacterized protein n=1 Tax=Onchocerca volvulus TaxID=6282 RepID=A0A8R1XKZ6_ONCVO